MVGIHELGHDYLQEKKYDCGKKKIHLSNLLLDYSWLSVSSVKF